jgi:hypothetical protein
MEDCEVGEDQPTSGRGLEFSSFRENRKEVTHAQSLQPAGTTGSNTISKLYMSSGEGVSLNPIFASPLFLAGVRRGSGLGLLVLDASAHSLSLSRKRARAPRPSAGLATPAFWSLSVATGGQSPPLVGRVPLTINIGGASNACAAEP